jgi:glycolate oxidase
MVDVVDELRRIVGPGAVTAADAIAEDDTHDECLTVTGVRPLAIVRPRSTAEVAAVLSACAANRVPVTARGGGTGLSGACVGDPGGIVLAFDQMAAILDVDPDDQVAVVQPGVTLARLDEALGPLGLCYPVEPGEASATVGGTIATNAGGMRAVRYGVTRHHVLGLELVLPSGAVLRTGGRLVKLSTGVDLTQLVIGSEGTLALVTEATLKLRRRPAHRATVLAPFSDLPTLAAVIPALTGSGVDPLLLEYLDLLAMDGVTAAAGVSIGVAADVRQRATAYLVVGLEARTEEQLDADVELVGSLCETGGALDTYLLEPSAAVDLVTARERAFFAAKAAGADDVVDVVVPRHAIPVLLGRAAELAAAHGSLVTGCGHAGDGNVHLSVFQPDAGERHALLTALFRTAMDLGGAVSGEHGLGRAKRQAFAELADPLHLALVTGIKRVFDPEGILGPGVGPAGLEPVPAARPGGSGDLPATSMGT